MFIYVYETSVVIFLLQGVASPLLLIFSGMLWWKQARQLESLKKEMDASRDKKLKSDDLSELILNGLPKLEPLNCSDCAGGLLLKDTEAYCPYCRTRIELPEDYRVSVSLAAELGKLLKCAIRRWRVANILTFPAMRWLFLLLIFIEPLALFPITLIGSNMFNGTWIDKLFVSMGETISFLIMSFAFVGFVVWMIMFIFLANLSKELRRRLPITPVFEKHPSGSETANCQACGGGIEYDKGDFACICSYCNVENFRVQFVRRERVQGEQRKNQTKSVLFGAMQILDEFVGTIFILLVFLVGCPMLFGILYAIRALF
jgi:Zn finger protein HypA/HybF involved in hydrogenase expression